MENQPQLPRRIIKLASRMFARDTGMSGPELHEYFAEYTDELGGYRWGGSPSRWRIFENGMSYLDGNTQQKVLRELCRDDGLLMGYGAPPEEDIEKLLGMLNALPSPGATSAVSGLDSLEDWDGVRQAWTDTLERVEVDPDGAITAARTTLESVCKHICDERGIEYEPKWDLSQLYRAASRSLNLAPDQHVDQAVKQVLSGMISVVNGLASLRNALGDAHGQGKRSMRPRPRHAKLVVNTAFAASGFLIDTHLERPADCFEPADGPAAG